MDMLGETVEKVEGAANLRQVCGFPVFGVGQPNPEGMKTALDKIKASCDEKNNKEWLKNKNLSLSLIQYHSFFSFLLTKSAYF